MIQSDEVTKAAGAFEARWTLLALARVNPTLAEALQEQCELYYEATVSGTKAQKAEHAEALIRGYAAAVQEMQRFDVADDAYLIGRYQDLVVVVSNGKAARQTVAELNGEDTSIKRVVLLTPDEIAYLAKTVRGFDKLADIKHHFPNAEVIERKSEGDK